MASEDPAVELARRLKMLREGRGATQAQLAAVLGVKVPSVSSWETKAAVPPPERLAGYALYFATDQEPGTDTGLPTLEELTPGQLREYEHLRTELLELRDATRRPPGSAETDAQAETDLLRFPRGERIVIVCGQMRDATVERPYTNPDDPEYDEFYTFADPRALLELYGELRRVNPDNEIRYKKSERGTLRASDYFNHLMLIGGVDWNAGTDDLVRSLAELPVRQLRRRDEADDVGSFIVGTGKQARRVDSTLTADGRLAEDIVHFYRGPNPFNPSRTVTLFSGNYARGTLGAVMALTHPLFRDGNQRYARTRFGRFTEFSILMRAAVVRNDIVTPDWTVESRRVHEWAR